MLLPPYEALPPPYQSARAYHVGINPSAPPLELLMKLRATVDAACAGSASSGAAAAAAGAAAGQEEVGGLLSAESFCAAAEPLTTQQLWRFCGLLDVFSPNEAEALSMLFPEALCLSG